VKVTFFSDTQNINTGSYRIWVWDLNKTFLENGIDSRIVYHDISKISHDCDVVVFCKSAYKRVQEFKQINNRALVGAINVSCDYYSSLIDFVIVGSAEEYASLGAYDNVFVYPLIERKFEKITRKVHVEKNDCLKICFHGHYPHLFKFEPFLKNAIERFDEKVMPVELHVITGNPEYEWKKGRPNVKVIIHKYGEDISSIIQSCDVGVVPNISDLRITVPDITKITSVDFGLYNTDYFFRLKNKTNAGRAYVFYQHGIPVIHDLSPSNFELMKLTGYNICAHDSNSWFRELRRLKNPNERERVSKAYFCAFKEHFDPHSHAKKLIEKIGEIKNEHR
jgi:hypothetical protein